MYQTQLFFCLKVSQEKANANYMTWLGDSETNIFSCLILKLKMEHFFSTGILENLFTRIMF